MVSVLLPLCAFGQQQVKGPRKVSPDSIEVTVSGIRLHIADQKLAFEDERTPRLYPTGSKEAQIWFSLGFMLDSCKIQDFTRIDSDAGKKGSTVNAVVFRCHYKASEFRSAIEDLME